MNGLTVVPDQLTAAAVQVGRVGHDVDWARQLAAHPTVGLVPAAADEVSVGITALFSEYAEGFHALSAQASVFHQQFTQLLHGSAGSYSLAEHGNAAALAGNPNPLGGVEHLVNSLHQWFLTWPSWLQGVVDLAFFLVLPFAFFVVLPLVIIIMRLGSILRGL